MPCRHQERSPAHTIAHMWSLVTGTAEDESTQKRGYKLPRNIMANADLTRLINSDEVQTIVRPPKVSRMVVPLKKNPLKNLGALLKLNPYAKAARRTELLAQVRRRPLPTPLPRASHAGQALEPCRQM